MKKYIVKITYDDEHCSIATLKAKNYSIMELKIAQNLNDIYGDLKCIKAIEYEDVDNRHSFSKTEINHFVGTTYLGVKGLEEILKRGKGR